MLFKSVILLLSVNTYLTTCALIGNAVFDRTYDNGLNGTIGLHNNPVFGTFLIGQVKGINCYNSTSATRTPNPLIGPVLNNCRLGLTINNWRQNPSSGSAPTGESDGDYNLGGVGAMEWTPRQTIVNMSNIKMPNIREILSGGLKPIKNLLYPSSSTPAPGVDDRIRQTNGSCADVGDVYNPRRDIMPDPLGFLSPPGVLGNLIVTNGTGSIMMGPLELLTAGPASVMGLPLVLWMDSIRPEINGSTITMKTGGPNRILGCSTINPVNRNIQVNQTVDSGTDRTISSTVSP